MFFPLFLLPPFPNTCARVRWEHATSQPSWRYTLTRENVLPTCSARAGRSNQLLKVCYVIGGRSLCFFLFLWAYSYCGRDMARGRARGKGRGRGRGRTVTGPSQVDSLAAAGPSQVDSLAAVGPSQVDSTSHDSPSAVASCSTAVPRSTSAPRSPFAPRSTLAPRSSSALSSFAGNTETEDRSVYRKIELRRPAHL